MASKLVVYGDQHVLGYRGGELEYLEKGKRWVDIVTSGLKETSSIELTLDGVNGRTIDCDGVNESDENINGSKEIKEKLKTLMPIEILLICLGHNDIHSHGKPVEDVADESKDFIDSVFTVTHTAWVVWLTMPSMPSVFYTTLKPLERERVYAKKLRVFDLSEVVQEMDHSETNPDDKFISVECQKSVAFFVKERLIAMIYGNEAEIIYRDEIADEAQAAEIAQKAAAENLERSQVRRMTLQKIQTERKKTLSAASALDADKLAEFQAQARRAQMKMRFTEDMIDDRESDKEDDDKKKKGGAVTGILRRMSYFTRPDVVEPAKKPAVVPPTEMSELAKRRAERRVTIHMAARDPDAPAPVRPDFTLKRRPSVKSAIFQTFVKKTVDFGEGPVDTQTGEGDTQTGEGDTQAGEEVKAADEKPDDEGGEEDEDEEEEEEEEDEEEEE